jgi:hypothetical protein
MPNVPIKSIMQSVVTLMLYAIKLNVMAPFGLSKLFQRDLVAYSQHIIFFVTYESDQ